MLNVQDKQKKEQWIGTKGINLLYIVKYFLKDNIPQYKQNRRITRSLANKYTQTDYT